uniref:Protein IQ-DOMAIN 1 n=1 Tax=Ananas comosus var. bracteatus TaxID=296719 RepID=A0A6V7QGL7_ANACO|nr:unnamed protein product [Ananas comosus var. bracteatus]
MGKKGKWFGAVKKVFSPESKEKKDQKSKKKWDLEDPRPRSELFGSATKRFSKGSSSSSPPLPPPHPHSEEIKLAEVENDQSKHAYFCGGGHRCGGRSCGRRSSGRRRSCAAHHTHRDPRQVERRNRSDQDPNSFSRILGKASTAGLERAGEIRSRRLRMNEENQALHRQLLLKHERELESLRMGEEWDDSLQSKEQIEASLVNKQEAAIRRERALAYAFSHQWKSSSRSANPMYMDPNNPQWGWSWLERWMAARSWEIQSKTDKENNTDRASLKATNQNTGEGEITRAYARRETKLDRPSPQPRNRIRTGLDPKIPLNPQLSGAEDQIG